MSGEIESSAFVDELEKIASWFVDVRDVEDEIGTRLNASRAAEVKSAINDRIAQSFSLRHPILTGVPTLGILPLYRKAQVVEDMSRDLVEERPELAEQIRSVAAAKREQDSRESAVALGALGLIGAANAFANR